MVFESRSHGPKGTYAPALSTWRRALVASIILMIFPYQFSRIGLDQPITEVGLGQPTNNIERVMNKNLRTSDAT